MVSSLRYIGIYACSTVGFIHGRVGTSSAQGVGSGVEAGLQTAE